MNIFKKLKEEIRIFGEKQQKKALSGTMIGLGMGGLAGALGGNLGSKLALKLLKRRKEHLK